MDKIAILDFGSQFAHLLANRIRRLGVYSEIHDATTPADLFKNYKGLILSGGPASVNDPNSPKLDPEIFNLGVPILGVCYGHQIIMHTLGGVVKKGTVGEYGPVDFTVLENAGVLEKLEAGATYPVYASHFDVVAGVPEGFKVVGKTNDDAFCATMNETRKIYTLQFHPEVTHSKCGMDILGKFVEITGAKREWDMDKFIEEECAAIVEKVGENKVFLLISGGVDSSVAYAILAKAIGQEKIYALYIDTGFMRLNETTEIQKFLSEAGVKNLHTYDASNEFFSALAGVCDPEQKRQIIGSVFLEVQKKVLANLGLNASEWILAQGTIYPDTIESGGTKNADKIKTHHNRVPEIEELIKQGKVIEPLKELYKDEVRLVGRKLGLPDLMVDRHPFPGPGLAVRCLCVDKPSTVDNAEIIEKNINDEFGGLNAKIGPIKSVGVQGDERTYRHPLLITTQNHNWEYLRDLSPKLTNKFKEINRVILTVKLREGMSIDKLEVVSTGIDKQRIERLQKADKLVMDFIYSVDTDKKVWQCPTVLLPLSVNGQNGEAIVIRPVSSTEAMTANFTELPWEGVLKLAEEILKIDGISAVFYDITNKPPATIEWE